MARTCEESLAIRAQFSKPRVLPMPLPVLAPGPPDSEKLEALLSHYGFWPFHRRLVRQYLRDNPTEAALAKVVARLEAFVADKQKHMQPRIRGILNRIHAPAYAQLYPEPED